MTRDPEIKCYLPGVPRAMYMPYPFQIIQSHGPHHDGLRVRRRASHDLHGDTRKRLPTAGWAGPTGIGKANRSSSTRQISSTRPGSTGPGTSTATRCTSSNGLTATGPDHLNYEVTIEDPNVFTRPWKMSMPLYRRLEKNAQVLEFKCVEFSEDMIYGHLRKVPLVK